MAYSGQRTDEVQHADFRGHTADTVAGRGPYSNAIGPTGKILQSLKTGIVRYGWRRWWMRASSSISLSDWVQILILHRTNSETG